MKFTTGRLRRLRVFIDANTLISGLFFDGPESQVLSRGILGTIDVMTCRFVVNEVKEVIRRKFPEERIDIDGILSAITIVETEATGRAAKLIRDKKDILVLNTALKHKPDYFITGDKDFHTLEIKKQIRIVTTKEFLEKHQ